MQLHMVFVAHHKQVVPVVVVGIIPVHVVHLQALALYPAHTATGQVNEFSRLLVVGLAVDFAAILPALLGAEARRGVLRV